MATKFDFCDTKIEIKPPGQKKRYISEIIWYDDIQNKYQEFIEDQKEQLQIPEFPDKVIKDIVVSVENEVESEGFTRWLVEGFIVEIIKFNLDTNEVVVAWTEFWEISQSPLFFYIDSLYQQRQGNLVIKWG